LPEGTVLSEYYLGCRLFDNDGNKRIEELVPIPDSYPIQEEFLPLVGEDAKLKLFPDTLWAYDKYEVVKIVPSSVGLNFIGITTVDPHGLSVGDQITGLSRVDHPFSGDWTVYSVDDDFNFTVRTFDQDAADFAIAENSQPAVHYVRGLQNDPISVYREDTLLSIGTDYLISIDGKETWLDHWPVGLEYFKAARRACAGRFFIKLVDPQHDKVYWSQYRPEKNQLLSKTGLIRLRNGSVVFAPELGNTKGTISTVIVQRSENDNPYITSLIQFYSLKVRENVP
jgi:hypothetical protein